MRLSIRHETVYSYAPPAPRVALRLRLFPRETAAQRPDGWRVSVGDAAVEPLTVNGWGEPEALWQTQTPVAGLTVLAEGTVETEDRAGVIGRIGQERPGVFLRETSLTRPDPAVRELAAAETGNGALLDQMHALSETVAGAVAYRPGATDAGTTAAEALALGAGVCQDRAHLFIAVARSRGIPARYVVGYLHDEAEPLAETHGWAETWLEGLGWVGFDPTNGISPTDAYVRLCSGLDAADASPIRGSIQGAAVEQMLQVAVQVAQAQQ